MLDEHLPRAKLVSSDIGVAVGTSRAGDGQPLPCPDRGQTGVVTHFDVRNRERPLLSRAQRVPARGPRELEPFDYVLLGRNRPPTAVATPHDLPPPLLPPLPPPP